MCEALVNALQQVQKRGAKRLLGSISLAPHGRLAASVCWGRRRHGCVLLRHLLLLHLSRRRAAAAAPTPTIAVASAAAAAAAVSVPIHTHMAWHGDRHLARHAGTERNRHHHAPAAHWHPTRTCHCPAIKLSMGRRPRVGPCSREQGNR